jgi:superfamily II DNA or RNA helicase
LSSAATSYETFLAAKRRAHRAVGFSPRQHREWLMPFQRALVAKCLERGSSALFASTGLGKTRMQLAWADEVATESKGRVLVLAPLAVAQQTEKEAHRLGLIRALNCRNASQMADGNIVITNYERLHHFNPSDFVGVVLDESSCIKNYSAKTTAQLTETFSGFRFRLAATATPAPNDFMELGTHAEFLGVSTRAQMLAEYFIHDGGDTALWRLKGHARLPFWRWVASWALGVVSPTDIGFAEDGERYRLPPLNIIEQVVPSEQSAIQSLTGDLFANGSLSLTQRREARKSSIDARVALTAKLVNETPGPWVVWCDLNAESGALASAIDGALEIRGSDDIEDKEQSLQAFATGEARVLVTKASIAGWGLNFQHCRQMAFVGLSDSFESYYQAVRRCWRFGQRHPVDVHVVSSELEGVVVANIKRKGAMAEEMAAELTAATWEALK